ncbi:MAG: hypothetical protein C4581_08770 [Nitrospiraceae bacterium]|nr:MAG: hypothetical protein C4581_08770 [Nitrospiraceae bacterium]
MGRQLLFVTYQNEDFDEGLSYAVDLAKTLDKDLTILMAQKKGIMKRLEDVMSAVTFAGAGEHETARVILSGKIESGSLEKLNLLTEKFQNEGVTTKVYIVGLDAVSAIKDFLRQKNSVDMVLLSPGVTDNGNIKLSELQKLGRSASKPVVTMSKQVYAA